MRGRTWRNPRLERAVAQLSHPHITAIHEVGEAEGHDFLAFECVHGCTLGSCWRGGGCRSPS